MLQERADRLVIHLQTDLGGWVGGWVRKRREGEGTLAVMYPAEERQARRVVHLHPTAQPPYAPPIAVHVSQDHHLQDTCRAVAEPGSCEDQDFGCSPQHREDNMLYSRRTVHARGRYC